MLRFISIASPLLLLLAACETPPPPCKPTNTVELRRIDALIVETERNLARGYTTAPARADGVRVCVGGGGGNVAGLRLIRRSSGANWRDCRRSAANLQASQPGSLRPVKRRGGDLDA